MVLSQEMERFNRLTQVLNFSLKELQKAIKGVVVMSFDLEQMYTNFLNNQVGGCRCRLNPPVCVDSRLLSALETKIP